MRRRLTAIFFWASCICAGLVVGVMLLCAVRPTSFAHTTASTQLIVGCAWMNCGLMLDRTTPGRHVNANSALPALVDARTFSLAGLSVRTSTVEKAKPENGQTFRHLEVIVPFWNLVLLFGMYPISAVAYRFVKRRHMHAPGHCSKCGYNLYGNVTGTCPECGCATKSSGNEEYEVGR